MNFQKYDDLFCRENYPVFNLEYLPEDNSACICLSGKEYGKCCKVDVEKHSLLQMHRIFIWIDGNLNNCLMKKEIFICSA